MKHTELEKHQENCNITDCLAVSGVVLLLSQSRQESCTVASAPGSFVVLCAIKASCLETADYCCRAFNRLQQEFGQPDLSS